MNNPEDEITLNYSFTKKEIGLLAKFLRLKETEIPHGLENFAKTIKYFPFSHAG